jgi:exopolysaccharide biosynthesis protein
MIKLLAVVVILAVAVVGLGFYRGWFSAESKTGSTGTEVAVNVDHEKFKNDKEQYQKKAEARLKELDAQLEKLTAKSSDATGDTKTQLEKDIETLKGKKEIARKKLGEIQEASAEKWEDFKLGMESTFDDLKKGFDSAASKFK